MRRIPIRYVVRNERGEELVVPSLDALHHLYEGGLLSDEDEVRQERSLRWTPLGAFPALHGVREARRDPMRLAALLAAALALAIAIGLMFAR